MINKSLIREYFIDRAKSSIVLPNIEEELEKLTVFSEDKKQIDMKTFWNDFHTKIISITSLNSIEILAIQNKSPDDLKNILAIQKWAKTTWKEGIKTADINKIIIAYIIIDRLFLFPDIDLDWEFSEEAKEKLKKYLSRLPELLTIDISTELPEKVSYSDRKFHNDYKEALLKGDHKGIIAFFSALAHGIGFHKQFDYFIKITAKLSVIIAPDQFAENLSKFPPYLMRYYLEYLDPWQISEVLMYYNALDPLPLLIGIIQIVNPQGNNRYDDKLLEDNELTRKASIIVEQIAQRITSENIYKYITDCSNIFMNKLWHCIFSAFIAKNNSYCKQYLEEIDFSYDVGEDSFNGFFTYSDNLADFDNFSKEIYFKYFVSLIGKHANRLIHFTSYFKYISQAILSLTDRSHRKYLQSLEQVSIELKRGIYSWKKDEWDMLLTKWMFWIISSKDFIERVEINRDVLKTTYELIYDRRITEILQLDAASLIEILEKPGRTGSIVLPVAGLYGDEKITINWDIPN